MGRRESVVSIMLRKPASDLGRGTPTFGCRKHAITTISRHIKGVLESGELDADSVVGFFATVRGFKTSYFTHNLR